ncbi:glycosyl transferase [Cellulomonas sp. CW35]|uniref:glycosyl transferase n=1 Tax=Cellulomonas sp. CW35 TaxID=3458249 RepID=UPI0040346F81
MTRHDDRPPVVLQSFGEPRPSTNPHMTLLLQGLREHLDVRTFSWREALLGRYHVLHVQWPEVVVTKSSAWRSVLASAAFVVVLARCAVRRTAVVRTLHNLAPHERQPWWGRVALRVCDRRTTWWVRLNDTTPVPDEARSSTIPLADYGDWYAAHPLPAATPGRVAYVGLVRPYKGVLDLVHAFRGLDDPESSLRVAGRPAGPTAADEIEAAAGDDPRVGTELRHLTDAELVAEVGAAQLVALPYRAMHNSGAVLLALTLGRPVLVPANEVTDALAREVGAWWVQRFDGPLTADALAAALKATADGPVDGPDLSRRSWPEVVEQHREVYASALRAVRRRAIR